MFEAADRRFVNRREHRQSQQVDHLASELVGATRPPGALLEHMVVRLPDPAVKVVAAGRTTQARCQARDGGQVSTTAAETRVSFLLTPVFPYGSERGGTPATPFE